MEELKHITGQILKLAPDGKTVLLWCGPSKIWDVSRDYRKDDFDNAEVPSQEILRDSEYDSKNKKTTYDKFTQKELKRITSVDIQDQIDLIWEEINKMKK